MTRTVRVAGFGVLVPDVLEQVSLRERLARPGHEVVEQSELLRRQLEVEAVLRRCVARQVELEAADLERRAGSTRVTRGAAP